MVNPLNFFRSRKKKKKPEDEAWQAADEALKEATDDVVEVEAEETAGSEAGDESSVHQSVDAVPDGTSASNHRRDQTVLLQDRECIRTEVVKSHRTETSRLAAVEKYPS